MADLATLLKKTSRGLIVVGRLDAPQDAPALAGLLQALGWPVFCDIASAMKGLAPADQQIFSLDHPEAVRTILAYAPETILQFGSALVSKPYDASLIPQSRATIIQVSPRRGLRDPAHRVSMRIQAPVHVVAGSLKIEGSTSLDREARTLFLGQMEALYRGWHQRIPEDKLSFPLIASTLLAGVPDGEGLFLGNSMVIRAFDTVRCPFPRSISVISNRGVSGIEGNIATSVGFAEGSGRRVTSVIGDISFLNDLNSLVLLQQSETPVVLVIVNNGGGRIFERLPIRDFPEIINPYMTTPHALSFKLLADQFALPYFRAGQPCELISAYDEALQGERSAMLEVTLSPEEDLRTFQALQKVRLP